MQNVTNMDQDIAEANFQGGLFDLPAGEVRGAFGVDWRKNTFGFQVDILGSNNSFQDGPIGLFPTNSTFGSTDVKEVYGELLVPVLADIPAIKRLNLELGYRFSDYDSGSVDTYKALVDWTIVDSCDSRRLPACEPRAEHRQAVLPDTQAVRTVFGDPCARNSTRPSARARPTRNVRLRDLCSQLMTPQARGVLRPERVRAADVLPVRHGDHVG
jgi:hypothetical protein